MSELDTYSSLFKEQQQYYQSGATLDYQSRHLLLSQLFANFEQHETALIEAVQLDFNKPEYETYMTEISQVRAHFKLALSQLKFWMKKKPVKTNKRFWPASSFELAHPQGQVLIITPYNYPILIVFASLIAAIAAGNTVMLKPSEHVKNTNDVIKHILKELPISWITLITGDHKVAKELLNLSFDHFFFTGSERVGRLVAQKAAQHLAVCTLELGGKSPVIVDKSANIELAAQRILWGKLINGGQTCIAPDFVWVHNEVEQPLLEAMREILVQRWGLGHTNKDYFTHMINKTHWQSASALVDGIDKNKIYCGGGADQDTLYIEPTILHNVEFNDACMKQEIFAPILPVMRFEYIEQLSELMKKIPQHPLACYVFSEDESVHKFVLNRLNFGGGCINHCLMQLSNENLSFGGAGRSGSGDYVGDAGFKRFSNIKGIFHASTRFDISLIYPPYTKSKLMILKKLLR
jgi:aldehyde dehydrogenase (NAD+)